MGGTNDPCLPPVDAHASITLSGPLRRLDEKQAEVQKYNDEMKRLAGEYHCRYIDNLPPFVYVNDEVDEFLFDDDVYLNNRGTGRLLNRLTAILTLIRQRKTT